MTRVCRVVSALVVIAISLAAIAAFVALPVTCGTNDDHVIVTEGSLSQRGFSENRDAGRGAEQGNNGIVDESVIEASFGICIISLLIIILQLVIGCITKRNSRGSYILEDGENDFVARDNLDVCGLFCGLVLRIMLMITFVVMMIMDLIQLTKAVHHCSQGTMLVILSQIVSFLTAFILFFFHILLICCNR